MSKIGQNINDIHQHRIEETTGKNNSNHPVLNLSVGRARIKIDGKEMVIWATQPNSYINNRQRKSGIYYQNDVYIGEANQVFSKNHPLWQIIQNSYRGTYDIQYGGSYHRIEIIDSAKYTMATYTGPSHNEVSLGVENESEDLRSSDSSGWWYAETNNSFSELIRILEEEEKEKQTLKKVELELKKTNDNISSHTENHNSFSEQKEQEKKKELEDKIKELLDIQENKTKQAQRSHLIFKGETLTNKENLAKDQNDAKFANLYQAKKNAVIINGGPGTGKTTTMIQRLKLLLSENDIKDNLTPECFNSISDKQKKLMKEENWIFFSPSDMLRRYLLNNMRHEGLNEPEKKSKVWHQFLVEQLSDEYQILQNFEASTEDETSVDCNPYIDSKSIVEDFEKFFITHCIEELKNLVNNNESFNLNIQEETVSSLHNLCRICLDIRKRVEKNLSDIETHIENYKTTLLDSLVGKAFESTELTLLYRIAIDNRSDKEIREQVVRPFISNCINTCIDAYVNKKDYYPISIEEQNIKQIVSHIIDTLPNYSDDILRFQKEDDRIAFCQSIISSVEEKILLKNNNLDRELLMKFYKLALGRTLDSRNVRDNIERNLRIKFDRHLRNFINNLSFCNDTIEDLQIAEFLEKLISADDQKELMSARLFKHENATLFDNYYEYALSNNISEFYNKYRENAYNSNSNLWNNCILKKIAGTDFRVIYQQEMSLLFGFINNACASYYSLSEKDFEESESRIIKAYKNNVYLVIGVDEATDYSLMDYFAILSMKRYEKDINSSFTLSGDKAQRLGYYSIFDWSEINTPWLFENIEQHELITSYRQSSSLNNLASKIYQDIEHEDYPYREVPGKIEDINPIQEKNENKQVRINWLCDRILEMKNMSDGKLFSTAIFTKDQESAEELYRILINTDSILYRNNLRDRILCWPNFDETRPNSIRILPISAVKGTEFPAVFLFDIDEMGDSEMIRRYLYIGVTRANCFFGVTSSGRQNGISTMLDQYLTHNVWK